MKSFLLLLFSFILISYGSAMATDLNAQGFALYQKGQYKKAKPLFEKALLEDSTNAYAHLNLARVIVALNGFKFPEDYCNYARNWIFGALHHLTQAIELKRDTVIEKIKAGDKGLAALEKSGEYQKWWVAASAMLPFKNDNAINDFIKKHAGWHNISGVPRFLTFSSGVSEGIGVTPVEIGDNWTVLSGKIQGFKNKNPVASYTLKRDLFYFDKGKKSIYKMYLVQLESQITWELDPVTGDCE